MTGWRAALAILLILPAVGAAEPEWSRWEAYALDLLQKYVRIATVSPPSNTRPAAQLIAQEFRSRGFEVKEFSSGSAGETNLLVRLPGRDRSRKPLLLLNHFDVVPVDAARWPVDPFAAAVRDGWLWGRGTLDMKGIGVQQMVAMMLLKEAGIVPARDILMLCTADEEMSGVHGIRWMLEHHPQELDVEYVLDEGGVVSADLLGQNRLVFGVAVAEKQMVWVRLRASGTAAHGSQPIPENANQILLAAIAKAQNLDDAASAVPLLETMRQRIGAMAVNKFTSAIQKNTVTLTTLQSGVGSPPKVNVIPSTAEATLDCRLMPGVDADKFLADMQARIDDPRVALERVAVVRDAGVSATATPLFSALEKAAGRIHPGIVFTPILIPYGTDSAQLRARGVKAYGVNPMALDASIIATMHSDGERIPLDQFYRGIRFFHDVLRSDF